MGDGKLASVLGPFANSPDLVVVVDEAATVVTRNRAAQAAAPEATTAIDQFSQAHGDLALARITAALATREPQAFEWGHIGLGGIRSWYSAVVTPLMEGGAIVSSRDITELKRSEERLRRSEQLMVDTQGVAHLGTWEWEITQPTATWSAELYRIYGLTPETYTPSYEAYLTMVHPDDRQRVIDATNRVFHEHVPYSHDERIYRPDGSIRFLHTWAFPVLDEAGTLVKLVGVCLDISDRKEAEEALHRLNMELEHRVSDRTQQLEVALRDLDGFNSMVSHDLRGPLAVMQLALDVIAHEELPPKFPPLLTRLGRAVENMSHLVSDLLAFAQVGQEAVSAVDVDISRVCAEIVAEQRTANPDRQVEVSIEPGLRLHADPSLLHIALTNLIANAWKYTSRTAAARIDIGTVERPEGRVLYVRDNGIGFAMSEYDKLFRPFRRLANASDFKGTGLGLATVLRIIERHEGTVRADAAPDQGATFFVVLPPSRWR